jgi:bifunctional polynucleotide phosphatase/kinase
VASFFTPTSQKAPDKLTYRIIDRSLIIAKYEASTQENIKPVPPGTPRKIAAFDLDDTVISPAGAKWARNAASWRWWDPCVPGKLGQLHRDGFLVVILSNQAVISLKEKDTLSLRNFKQCLASLLPQLDIPISVYAATGQDKYRKPRIGMWQELLEDYDLEKPGAVDLEGSVFVGDASGRPKTDTKLKDHSSSDRSVYLLDYWTKTDLSTVI